MSAQLWQQVTWDVARAGGILAYLLLTVSVALGLALSMRWQRPRWPRLFTNELHGFVALLCLVFVAVHVLAVVLDPYTRFGWRDVLVPLATSYRPVWMALGIVGLYLLLAVWISTGLRARIGYAWWRKLHTGTFAIYLLATLHGLATGTDTLPALGARSVRRQRPAPRRAADQPPAHSHQRRRPPASPHGGDGCAGLAGWDAVGGRRPRPRLMGRPGQPRHLSQPPR